MWGLQRRRLQTSEHVQVRFLWQQDAVADGTVEVVPRYLRSWTGKGERALHSMMPLTQFGGQGRAVGAALELLAGLPVAAGR